jgi:hypothetical protein
VQSSHYSMVCRTENYTPILPFVGHMAAIGPSMHVRLLPERPCIFLVRSQLPSWAVSSMLRVRAERFRTLQHSLVMLRWEIGQEYANATWPPLQAGGQVDQMAAALEHRTASPLAFIQFAQAGKVLGDQRGIA